MPLVAIYLRKGKTPEYLRSVGDAIHGALVAEAAVPADDRFQIFHEIDADRSIVHPSYGGVTRTEDLVIIQITLNAGRTTEVKRRLFAAIAAGLQRDPGVRPDDVLISLVEVAKENWSFGKGLLTYG